MNDRVINEGEYADFANFDRAHTTSCLADACDENVHSTEHFRLCTLMKIPQSKHVNTVARVGLLGSAASSSIIFNHH